MPKLRFLQLLFLFLACFTSLCQACNQIDQDSLLSLSLNLSSLPLNSWSSSTDCCRWEGIKCDASGRVNHLWLPWKGLSGTISPTIGSLTHLSHLNLSHNSLSGHLPVSSFSSLTQLETLDLSFNQLSGEFPPSLSLNNIEFINLSSNQFQGMIPSNFFQLTRNLISFDVSNNSFTGLIPCSAWIDSFCSIGLLDFSYNEFIGQIPLGLGNCSKLQTFRAGFNFLSGPIPDDTYAATSLEELSLPVNNLSGSIRNGIVNLTSLRILELYSNHLTGLIPQDIGMLTNLEILKLYDNFLSGSLPASMENCTNLTSMNLNRNLLQGHISVFNFSRLLKLHTLELSSNLFSGSLPMTLNSCKSLTVIGLTRNQLEGQISPDIVALKSLSFLSLSNISLTNITGAVKNLMGCNNLKILIISMNFVYETVPDDHQITVADGFQNLEVLSVGNSQLKGQIPSWLGKLRKLQVLDLSLNQLTGSVPGCLGNMTSLFYMDLSDNFLSGEFPNELCRLPALALEQENQQVNRSNLPFTLFIRRHTSSGQYNKIFNLPPAIYLGNNSLCGSIPVEISQLKLLHVLDLSHNNFSGNIPEQISQLINLERMDLSGNHLSGEIPVSLKALHFLSALGLADNNLRGSIPSGGQFDTFPPSSFQGNPELCGVIVQRSCSVQPSAISTVLPKPSESSNVDLYYGLTSGVIFGFIIGCTIGILYPLQRLQRSRYNTRH